MTEKGEKYSYTVAYISTGHGRCLRQISITNDSKKTFSWDLTKGSLFSQRGSLNLTYSNYKNNRDRWYQIKGKMFSYVLSTSISEDFRFDVTLKNNKPPLVHNGGVIQMGLGGNSFYYSLTNLALRGEFLHDGVVENVEGVAWIDRQWGSWSTVGYDGWEWFALQLNDSTEIMLYVFYDFFSEKRLSHVLSIMFSDGSSVNLKSPDLFTLTNLGYWQVSKQNSFVSGIFRNYFSSGWRLLIPKYGLDLTIKPVMRNQQIGHSSWEGSCYVAGRHKGTNINSIGTVELTHRYAYPFQVRLVKNVLIKSVNNTLRSQRKNRQMQFRFI